MTPLFAVLTAVALLVAAMLAYKGRATPRLTGIVIAGIVLVAGISYAWIGSPHLMPVLAAWHVEHDRLEQRITELRTAARSEPKAVKPWAALGQAYMEAQAFSESAEAYKHAVVLSRGAPELILQYNKALIFQAGGTVKEEAKHGLDIVLVQDKHNLEAQYFVALWNFQQGNTAVAMHDMRRIYHALPKDALLKHVIDRQIGRE